MILAHLATLGSLESCGGLNILLLRSLRMLASQLNPAALDITSTFASRYTKYLRFF